MGPQSAEALHLMIEAKKLAFEDACPVHRGSKFAEVPSRN